MSDRWDRRYADRRGPLGSVDEGVVTLAADLSPGRALDLAGGDGRHAAWLQGRGWRVTLVDGSEVALERARALLPGVEARRIDLEDTNQALPVGPFELVLISHYFQPTLLPRAGALLAPGGHLLFVQPTTTNLQRHPRPSARFLVDPEELPGLAGELELVHVSAEWRADGRHVGWLLARR